MSRKRCTSLTAKLLKYACADVPFCAEDFDLGDASDLISYADPQTVCRVLEPSMKFKLPQADTDDSTEGNQLQMCRSVEVYEEDGWGTTITALAAGQFQVQVVGRFCPVVNEPYMMGRIGCASLLSSLYTMGVSGQSVLMQLTISWKLTELQRDVFVPLMVRGFEDGCKEADVKISGQQIEWSRWLSIGGVALGFYDASKKFIVPEHAVPGDVLVLTKPLGTHEATRAFARLQEPEIRARILRRISEQALGDAYRQALKSMGHLNRVASLLMNIYNAHAVTAIGEHGFMKHAEALAQRQQENVSFCITNIPVIAGMQLISKRLVKGLSPEMSGGLLICMAPAQASQFIEQFNEAVGYQPWIVGSVESGSKTVYMAEDARIIEQFSDNGIIEFDE
ncbi:inactive selenide water dikinase-like protein [Drosophila madeirensis]|uniref:Inactive selenide water dikinase-like protein n=1 Tax=Drosophila madeirensis TaxID=30013 RepID=A0AAU9FZ41_DROMD